MNAMERNRSVAAAALVALGAFACGSSLTPPGTGTGGTTGMGGGTGAGGSAGAGGDIAITGDGGAGGTAPGGAGGSPAGCTPPAAGEVPTEHRATAAACSPSTRAPAPPDGGAQSCTLSADCAAAGNAFYTNCLHGQCSFDVCLTDADCGTNAVCVCASDYYGGNAAFHPNVCVQASCRVDSDCGAGGYCSPTHASCGTFTGFYCHGPADTCVDATKDCGSCQKSACIYSPAIGAFTCGASSVCAG
jgi:hypothetical protein